MSTEVFEKLTNDEDMSHLQFGFFFHDLPRNLVQFASCRRRQLPNPPRDPSADQRVQTSHERRKLSPSNPPSDRKTWLRRCAGMLKKRTCVRGRAAQRVGEQRASPGFAVMWGLDSLNVDANQQLPGSMFSMNQHEPFQCPFSTNIHIHFGRADWPPALHSLRLLWPQRIKEHHKKTVCNLQTIRSVRGICRSLHQLATTLPTRPRLHRPGSVDDVSGPTSAVLARKLAWNPRSKVVGFRLPLRSGANNIQLKTSFHGF